MTTTLYIVKAPEAYEFGWPPKVQLWEPESLSRTWIRRLSVELPSGFEVSENYYGEPLIFREGRAYDLGVNKAGNPVIIDHTNNSQYIPIKILSEGWD